MSAPSDLIAEMRADLEFTDERYLGRCSSDNIHILIDHIASLEAEREALREAPFANRAFIFEGLEDDWFCQPSVQIKHLRAARALLPRQDRLSGKGEGNPNSDPICRQCATQEHGSPPLPEKCVCGDHPAGRKGQS
ncbi:hypothetical protein [Mesorhizobium sp. M0768]|uniref:hypothetical protein n=1 Tax=Mesorhizobium sp. M0768 TaxID=2956996 RepID=UPI00333B93AB